MPTKNWKNQICSIPNLLSFFRILLIPVYIVIYLRAENRLQFAISAGILAVSCMTDGIDGWIARKYNMVTTLGKILDPVADKATQFSLILCLSARYPQLLNLLVLFVVKELFQAGLGMLFLRRGFMLSGAIPAGKLCTTILFISLIMMVLIPGLPERVILGIATADCICLIFSFGAYILAYFGKDGHLEELEE